MIDTRHKVDVPLLQKAEAIGKLIGNTPMLRIRHWENKDISVYAKAEWTQLSGSVKARAAYNIIINAIREGKLNSGTRLLDATSGNTGIAYATICKQLGIAVTLCLPENASQERKNILSGLGVDIVFTSPFEGTDGAQEKARELSLQYPNEYYYADQYKNQYNWKAHFYSTAPEILKSVPEITHFTAGLGTTGTFTGTGRQLKETNQSIRLVSLQPDYPLHGMEGWKHLETAVVPGIYDDSLADETLEISTEEAYKTIESIYKQENILISPSSAANLAGAFRIAEKNTKNVVVTILPDNADKYKDVIKYLNL
jgi:S-sulfo-L-cysteine synthase (O-acetyl-L-serine-dependent)